MKKKLQEKQNGITLIALIITIIVLLILAGITIATLTGENGILTQAQNAKNEMTRAEAEERIKLEVLGSYGTNGSLDIATLKENIAKNVPEAIIKGEKFPIIVTLNGYSYKIESNGKTDKIIIADRTGLNVGDYIDYKPDTVTTAYTKLGAEYTGYDGTEQPASLTQDTLNWQILKIYDDGSMDVIGSPTSVDIYFKGARGYNNGVYVLNNICEELYSKKSEGITARSVNKEDFYNNMTDAGKQAKASDISNRVSALTTGTNITNVDKTNNTVTYVKASSYYPLLYKQEQLNGLGQSEEYYTESTLIKTDGKGSSYDQEEETLTVNYTYYNIATNATNYGDASKSLSNSNSFWLASRFVSCFSSVADFGLRRASIHINGYDMFDSNGNPYSTGDRVRPVVHLGAEVQIEACAGTNGIDNMHTITQY